MSALAVQAPAPLAAVLVLVRNPMVAPDARDARRLELPTTVRHAVADELAAHPGVPITCQLNGAWLLRAGWDRALEPGDIVTLVHETQGGGGDSLRTVLQIAAIIAINTLISVPGSVALTIGARIAATLAVNAILYNLIPPVAPNAGAQGAAPSPTYTFGLQGNQPAPEDPIEVQYGYMRFFPRFAAQPYAEFDNRLDVDGNPGNDQYYHAVLTIGQGEYAVKRIELDDTDINSFAGVTTNIVEPGGSLTLVDANVATAVEVTGQELDTAHYVPGAGGYAACAARRTIAALGFDIVLNGLGVAGDDGSFSDKSVTVRFERRTIDDFGQPISSWTVIGTETITAHTAQQVRRSFKYTIGSPARFEVRAVRTDSKDDNQRVLNTVTWSGLRAYLAETASLAPTATYLEVRAKASEQLNGLSQRRIAVLATRKLETWSPGGGWSGTTVETRNPAWAGADVVRNATYGKGLPDRRSDLATLYALAQTWDARQDRFDFRFDSNITAEQALQTIYRAGRAVPILRGGVWTVMRDEAQTLPVALFTPRNMYRGTFSIDDRLPTSETPDAVDVRYFSNRAWDWITVRCPAPGVTTPQRPQVVTIEGIGGAKQAEREGRYLAADTFYRRRLVNWESELDAQLAAYGALVLVAHDLPQWAQFGDVVDWDVDTLTMTLSEPPVFAGGSHYLRLHRPNGSVHAAILVAPGPAVDQVVLAVAPDFTPIYDDAGSDRTRYAFGTAAGQAQPCRVKGITPRGADRFGLQVLVEDDRVHTADNALLPAPGETQDPIDATYGVIDDGDGGLLLLVTLMDHYSTFATGYTGVISAGSAFSGDFGTVATVTLLNDGRASRHTHTAGGTDDTRYYPTTGGTNEWLNVAVGPSDAGRFEVLLTQTAGSVSGIGSLGAVRVGTFDAWLPLSTTRTVGLDIGSATPADYGDTTLTVNVQIRDAATHVVQASRTLGFALVRHSDGGGGGGP